MNLRTVLLAGIAAFAAATPALPQAYSKPADGVWECATPAGIVMGRLTIEGTDYSFAQADGTATDPGTSRLIDWVDRPQFVFLSGYLLTELGIVGAVVRDVPVAGQYPLVLILPNAQEAVCLRPNA